MPLGAERVGTAYVRIIADGSGLSDDIRDELRQSEPAIEAQGRKDGQVYADSFKEGISKNENDIFRSFREALDTGAGRNDATARILAGSLFNDFEREIENRVGDADIARIIRLDLEKQFRRGSSLESVATAFGRNYEQMVESAVKRIQGLEERVDKERRAREQAALDDIFKGLREARAQREALQEAELQQNLAALRSHERDVERLREEELAQFRADIIERYRLEDEAARQREELANQEIAERLRGERAYDAEVQRIEQDRIDRLRADIIERSRLADEARKQEIKDLRAGVRALTKDLNDLERGSKGASATQSRLRRSVLDLRNALQGYDEDGSLSRELTRINSELDRMTPRFDRVNKRLGDFENLIGRSTGKGSRNNFLNFVGSLTQGITGLIGKLPRFGALLGDTFSKGFDSKGGGFSGFIAGITAAGGVGIKAIASNVATLAAALAAAAIAIGPLVAGLSLLLGIVVALAGSLTFALFGAVAAATAAFVPFAFAVGTAVTALQGLDKAQRKALANDFKPLVQQAKELRSALADAFVGEFDSEGVSSNLTAGLKTVQPLLASIAEAVADVAERFSQVANSEAFSSFVTAMQRVLPDAIRNIGDGLAGFTEGFLGVLRALAPTIRDVAESIGDAGDRFAEWANSAEGQRELRQFFSDAADSLRSVKNFLGEVIGLLGDLFGMGGREAGDNIFDSMTEGISDFRDQLDEADVQQWFEDAQDFADSLGSAFQAAATVLDALDNQTNRRIITGFFGAFEIAAAQTLAVFDTIAFAIRGLSDLIIAQVGVVLTVVDSTLGNLAGGLSNVPGLEFLEGVSDTLDNAKDSLAGVREEFGKAGTWLKPSDLARVADLSKRLNSIPEEVITEIVADGAKLSANQIASLAKEYDLLPKEVRTLTRLLGDAEAKRRVDDVIKKTQEYGRQRPEATLTARAEQAIDAIQRALGLLSLFRDKSVTVTTNFRTNRLPSSTGPGPVDEFPTTAGRTVAPRATSLASPFPEAAPRLVPVGAGSEQGRSIDASGWTIVTPSEDPRTVAAEVLNEIAAKVM